MKDKKGQIPGAVKHNCFDSTQPDSTQADSAQQELALQQEFITKLQKQAKIQSKLEKTRLLPRRIDSLASLVARYPWQTILLASALTTLLVEVIFNV